MRQRTAQRQALQRPGGPAPQTRVLHLRARELEHRAELDTGWTGRLARAAAEAEIGLLGHHLRRAGCVPPPRRASGTRARAATRSRARFRDRSDSSPGRGRSARSRATSRRSSPSEGPPRPSQAPREAPGVEQARRVEASLELARDRQRAAPGRRRRRRPRFAQAGADSSTSAPPPAAAAASVQRKAALHRRRILASRAARSPHRPARARDGPAARRPPPRGSSARPGAAKQARRSGSAGRRRPVSIPAARARDPSALAAAGVAPSSDSHQATSRSTLAWSPASSMTTRKGRSPGSAARRVQRSGPRRRPAGSLERAGAGDVEPIRRSLEQRDARRTRAQAQPGALDHAQRPERARVELVQVVARHVLHDPTAAARARAVRQRDLQPEHAVARAAEALRARTQRRRRERAAQRRAASRRIQRQLPSARLHQRLDRRQPRPGASVADPFAGVEDVDPRQRRGREQQRCAPRRVPELEAAATAADHAGERQAAEGCAAPPPAPPRPPAAGSVRAARRRPGCPRPRARTRGPGPLEERAAPAAGSRLERNALVAARLRVRLGAETRARKDLLGVADAVRVEAGAQLSSWRRDRRRRTPGP